MNTMLAILFQACSFGTRAPVAVGRKGPACHEATEAAAARTAVGPENQGVCLGFVLRLHEPVKDAVTLDAGLELVELDMTCNEATLR